MIPASVREEISRYLGSEPRPYFIPSLEGDVATDCEYWLLPPLREEDQPIHVRYQEISARIMHLMEEDKTDPRIDALTQEANELIQGARVSKRSGTSLISMDELLKLDPWKGIRKEWWDLRKKFRTQDACIFHGFQKGGGAPPGDSDTLIAMPGQDPYEFLRIQQTQGNNRPVSTAGIISALEKIDREHRIAIVGATPDSVEFIFEKPVEAASTTRIRRRLSRLCPSAESLTEGIRLGRVALWWD